MSYEYTATWTAETPTSVWPAVVRGLSQTFSSGLSVPSDRRACLSLGSVREARNPGWGSDVDIVLTGNQLQVAFHSASAAQREQVLAVLGEALRDCGIPTSFEEP